MQLKMLGLKLVLLWLQFSMCFASYVLLKQYPMPDYFYPRPSKCQPLTIPVCQTLGYNSTRLPERMYLTNTRQSEIVRYLQFFKGEKCWSELLFFVCTMFNPVCFKNHPERVLPCKSVCQNVQHKCEKAMKKLQIDWPTELSCDNLPDYETKVCIKPKSIVTRKKYVDSQTDVQEKKCPACPQKNKLRRYKQFVDTHYAIQAQYMSKTKTANGKLKLRFKILKVFKSGKTFMKRYEMINLWSNSPCLCQQLDYDKKYLIFGQEAVHNELYSERLYLDEKTIIVRKTHQRKRLLRKWRRRYEKSLKQQKEKLLVLQNYDEPILHRVLSLNKYIPASSK
ncbi:secreted frizzled-related protein 3-like [Hydractinia symbiolongicarpus]|uniref:secreted frizzled-related protein 3-like n=1 Tax=Hydractinia symbiolongicarpus TaxID=13093 RepID=UPI0025509A24|nr:secreted frizzled-related protein 3-like [Hydractinia symbiolongicarpus]